MSSNESWKEETLKRYNFVKLQYSNDQRRLINDFINAGSSLNADELQAINRNPKPADTPIGKPEIDPEEYKNGKNWEKVNPEPMKDKSGQYDLWKSKIDGKEYKQRTLAWNPPSPKKTKVEQPNTTCADCAKYTRATDHKIYKDNVGGCPEKHFAIHGNQPSCDKFKPKEKPAQKPAGEVPASG